MKNARRLIDHTHLIKKHRLDTTSPPPDSLFWKMWHAGGQHIAKKALDTDFIQGIQSGRLNPIRYGAFNISDIYYCFSGAADYGDAAARTAEPILKDYLQHKQHSYHQYNESACATWRLTGPQSISPTPTARHYSAFERSIAKGTAKQGDVTDPIFTLIVMLPCEYLWAWLAAQLAPPTPNNLYANWITENNDPSGAYAMGNFLQQYISNNPIDEKLAMDVYLAAMEYEYRNFDTAMQ